MIVSVLLLPHEKWFYLHEIEIDYQKLDKTFEQSATSFAITQNGSIKYLVITCITGNNFKDKLKQFYIHIKILFDL